ncbi:MAG: hypothetical protein DHS20C11_16390 [Lysobacteraceae bacterium]|nr:MAG: hypothetical protein DHS20C11_16390 [Xanthomonadaceae bacterium]
MSDKPTTNENPGTIRLCTCGTTIYRAFSRPYDGAGSAPVLNLFASCTYGSAPWDVFFVGVEGEPNTYKLMEKVPGIQYYLITNYAISYSSGAGLLELGDTVTIIDARGEHQVTVEALQ